MKLRAAAPVSALLFLLSLGGALGQLQPAGAQGDAGGQAVSVSLAGSRGPGSGLPGTTCTNFSCTELGITCQAYLVYDLNASKPVALYNLERTQPIASLTKLMTAILACEHLRFDGRYILSPAEQKMFGTDSMRADKMLEMALIPSNNEICKVIARLVGGDEAGFALLMNRRAAELGMKNSHFVNCNGLPAKGQYSTPVDVAILGRAALAYPAIRSAMSQPEVELNGKVYKGTLHDLYARHNNAGTGRLLAGKTGFTSAAGRCLCLLYQSGGHQYLVVTLGSKGVKSSFRDAEQLLNSCGLYHGEVGTWQ